MLRFTLVVVFLFLILFTGSVFSQAMQASDVAGLLLGLAIILLGMLLIRQLSLFLFRRIIPTLGMQPPRILEEILILLAYLGWILFRLSVAGLDLGSLVASTAVITAVLAFAMQDTLGNILAGLALQLDHSIHIGDWLELDQISGEIIQVQWRHTAMLTLFGEKILVPNSQLMKAQVKITGGHSVPRRLHSVIFYADLNLPATRVIQAVEQALRQAEISVVATEPPAECFLIDFSNGLATYTVRYWLIDPRSPGSGASIVRQHIQALFLRNGWEMAAPGMALRRTVRQDSTRADWPEKLPDAEQCALTLRSIHLFSPLTDQEINSLAKRLQALPYVDGSVLARQGEVGDSLYVIQQGHVAVWLEKGGRRHLLAEVGPGEIVGEMSLMTGDPRRATLTACNSLVCYRLGKKEFREILEQRPPLAEAFAQLLASRNQELAQLRDTVPTVSAQTEQAAILSRIRRIFRV